MANSNVPPPEGENEVTDLIESVRRAMESLNPADIDAGVLLDVRSSIDRLVEIGELRQVKENLSRELIESVGLWEKSHSDIIDGQGGYAEGMLSRIREAVAVGSITAEKLKDALNALEDQLNVRRQQDVDLKLLIERREEETVADPSGDRRASEASTIRATHPTSSGVSVDPVPSSHSGEGSSSLGEATTELDADDLVAGSDVNATNAGVAGESPAEPSGPTPPPTKSEITSEQISKEVHAEDDAASFAEDHEKACQEAIPQNKTGSGSAGSRKQSTRSTILSELTEGRTGIAYHLARSTANTAPTARAIQLVAANYAGETGGALSSSLHSLAAETNDEVQNQLAGVEQPFRHEYAALLASATLWPAVVAPGGSAGVLLKALAERHLHEMESLQRLAKVGGDVSIKSNMGRLPLELLRGDMRVDLDQWRLEVGTRQKEIEDWIEHAKESTTAFAAATKVWRRMLENSDRRGARPLLGRMLSEMNLEGNLSVVKQTRDYWQKNGENEIDLIDRSMRTGPTTKRIEGNARNTIIRKMEEALNRAAAWIDLIESQPRDDMEYQDRLAKQLRDAVQSYSSDAKKEVMNLSRNVGLCCSTLLERYASRFGDEESDQAVALTFNDILHGDLLSNPSILVDDTGRPMGQGPSAAVMQKMIGSPYHTLPQAAVERAEGGDFVGARAAVDLARKKEEVGADEADHIDARIDSIQDNLRRQLKTRADEAIGKIDAAHASGDITAEDSESMRDEIPMLTDLMQPGDVEAMEEVVDSISQKLAQASERRRKETKARLESLEDVVPADRDRIAAAIDGGHIQVAEDYIERIESGSPLPSESPDAKRPFDEFFPDFLESYIEFKKGCDGHSLDVVCKVLNSREIAGPVDASLLSEEEAEEAFRFLSAWVQIHRDKQDSREKVGEFLEVLGLSRRKLRKQTSSQQSQYKGAVFHLETDTIADGRVVQLPAFGSSARGHYNIVTIRNRRVPASIMRATVVGTIPERPKIVLVFGVLDSAARKSLARESYSKKYQRTLVMDEALAVYLATRADDRRSAFFDCASAFTFAQPFDADAPEVPPEMFVGREEEGDRIKSKEGDRAHLVYGGRRLGKTALLRNVAAGASEHDRRVYLDLRGTGIGRSRPSTELWPLVAESLEGVLGEGTRTEKGVIKGIRAWISGGKDVNRRVLLLVDEADDFLEAEGRNSYPVLAAMKKLMDDTARDFKVVFAGLRDVQRATRDPNMPLAHLGVPVKIGPMLPETDNDAIEGLIRDPLEALGYRFQSNDSVIRIAAETNYYPGLAQQFCRELLRELREGGPRIDGPPYLIESEMVDRVFESPETRRQIRDRFRWTIELDRRYEFLTYLIARQGVGGDSRSGVSVETIHAQALSEWPEGFGSDRSFEGFEVLLDEMVGLGILRRTDDAHYAIRTRNLRMLLGNDDEIERRFSDAKSKPLPADLEPSQFRSDVRAEGLVSPSPLTASQEDRLLSSEPSVALVFGTRLADVGTVSQAIHQMKHSPGGATIKVTDVTMRNVLRETDKYIGSRREGLHLLLVSAFEGSGGLDPKAVGEVAAMVSRQKSTARRIVRPVFLASAASAWDWLENRVTVESEQAQLIQEMWLTACSVGFAQRWLEDRKPALVSDLQAESSSALSPWPLILKAAAGHSESLAEAVDLVAANQRNVSDVWGMERARRVLYVLSEYDEPMTIDDVAVLAPDVFEHWEMDLDEVEKVLNWASRLGIVHRGQSNSYCIDATYLAGRPESAK